MKVQSTEVSRFSFLPPWAFLGFFRPHWAGVGWSSFRIVLSARGLTRFIIEIGAIFYLL